jgi:hypothetical protein
MISFSAMESFTLQSTYKIHSGYEIPIMGLGVSYNPFISLMDPKFPKLPFIWKVNIKLKKNS